MEPKKDEAQEKEKQTKDAAAEDERLTDGLERVQRQSDAALLYHLLLRYLLRLLL